MAELHIEIPYDGEGLPSREDLEVRHQIEDAIEEAEIGEVVDSGGGEGTMDIFVEVEEPEAGLDALRELILGLGLQDRATVQNA